MIHTLLLLLALAGPIVGPPCGQAYEQFDPVTNQVEHIAPWWYVDRNSEGDLGRPHCDVQPAPAPVPEPEPPSELPVQAWLPWVGR